MKHQIFTNALSLKSQSSKLCLSFSSLMVELVGVMFQKE